ncbi:MAG: potassium channel family protein [Fusobacteriaceae bacterium]
MLTGIKRFNNSLLGFFAVFALGILGYVYIENYTLLNAFYMTSITLGTVGFSEVQPLTGMGKIFTSFLIFAGITVYIYCISTLTSLIVEGELKNYFKDVKKSRMIEKLKEHYIVVGYGRTGEKLVENFHLANFPIVIIEKDPDAIKRLQERYTNVPLYILGDATEDAVLEKAGIDRAKCLIPVLSDDSDNLFVTMSSKLLNPAIRIVTRLNEKSNYAKLKKVGANKILSSFDVTADRIYSMAIESNILTFQDMVEGYKNTKDLNLARITISENCEFRNCELLRAEIPKKTGLIIIGVERNGELLLNPTAATEVQLGDKLLVMGNLEQIKILESMS